MGSILIGHPRNIPTPTEDPGIAECRLGIHKKCRKMPLILSALKGYPPPRFVW